MACCEKVLDITQEAYKVTKLKPTRREQNPNHSELVILSTCYLQSLQLSIKLGPRFMGPFPIKCIINPVTVELEVPKSLHRVYLVFHCSLLKREVVSSIRPSLPPSPATLMVEGEQHFEIREFLDSRRHTGELQYLVTWKDFPKGENKWVNHCHMFS